MLLNGRSLYATASLDVALRQIRKMQAVKGAFRSQLLWADAVCINQDDEIEKGWQVSKMNRIFEDAVYALVWLGPSFDDSDRAVETLEHVGFTVNSSYDPFDNTKLRAFDMLAKLDNFSSALKSLP